MDIQRRNKVADEALTSASRATRFSEALSIPTIAFWRDLKEPAAMDDLFYITNHLFLPLRLPQSDDRSPSSEHALVATVATSCMAYVGLFETKENLPAAWSVVEDLLQGMEVIYRDVEGDYCAEDVASRLAGMQTGGTPLAVHCQFANEVQTSPHSLFVSRTPGSSSASCSPKLSVRRSKFLPPIAPSYHARTALSAPSPGHAQPSLVPSSTIHTRAINLRVSLAS